MGHQHGPGGRGVETVVVGLGFGGLGIILGHAVLGGAGDAVLVYIGEAKLAGAGGEGGIKLFLGFDILGAIGFDARIDSVGRKQGHPHAGILGHLQHGIGFFNKRPVGTGVEFAVAGIVHAKVDGHLAGLLVKHLGFEPVGAAVGRVAADTSVEEEEVGARKAGGEIQLDVIGVLELLGDTVAQEEDPVAGLKEVVFGGVG